MSPWSSNSTQHDYSGLDVEEQSQGDKIDMEIFQILAFLITLASTQSKPTTESTHDILKRLGFDSVQRSPVNHHNKRVALETNKARYHNDFYNSDTDSRMFVVKLPPHSPYYSHMRPEKFKNEDLTKKPVSFRTNGKPGQIYHWNIPIIKRLPIPKKGTVRNVNEDSKVYHIKILPNQSQKFYSRHESHKNNNKHKKHKYEERLDTAKPNKFHRNKFYRFSDPVTASQNNTQINQDMSDSQIQNISMSNMHDSHVSELQKSKNHVNKKLNDKYMNEVSKIKNKNHGPNYYVPAIPKQNSFYKYFTGNGKPKSFYVIEKSKKPTRLHRLL